MRTECYRANKPNKQIDDLDILVIHEGVTYETVRDTLKFLVHIGKITKMIIQEIEIRVTGVIGDHRVAIIVVGRI